MSSPTVRDKLLQRCRDLGIDTKHHYNTTAKGLRGVIRLKELGSMGQRIDSMLHSTWDSCANDWLAMYPKAMCRGDAVQECVADADRFDMAGDKEAAATWRELDRETQDNILESIFPRKETFGY